MKKTAIISRLLGACLDATVTWGHGGNTLDVSLGLSNVLPDIESPVVGVEATDEVKPS